MKDYDRQREPKYTVPLRTLGLLGLLLGVTLAVALWDYRMLAYGFAAYVITALLDTAIDVLLGKDKK